MCSCGVGVKSCAFWQRVLDRAGIGEAELAELAMLERRVVRNKFLAPLLYDLRRIRPDADVARFNALQSRLFDGVRLASGSEIVLDSSKAGPRAWVMAAAEHPPVLLHLYRDPADVIASWRKPKFEPSTGTLMKKPSLARAAWDWIKVEQAARSLQQPGQTVCRVDYLAFAQSPRTELAVALDQYLPGLVDSVAWQGETKVVPRRQYHSVLGNPDRFFDGMIEIQPKRVPRGQFSRLEAIAIGSIAAVLQWIYR